MFRRVLSPILALTALLWVGVSGCGGDEHPTEEHPAEEPKSEGPGVSKQDLSLAIQAFVKTESEKHAGFFEVDDKGGTLKLSLDRVHEDRLSALGDETYFVCADFKTAAGKLYDLDFFMKGSSPDSLSVTETSVHKEEGQERYTWHEKDGLWSKKQVGASKTEEHAAEEHSAEHPEEKPADEHPAEHPAEHPE